MPAEEAVKRFNDAVIAGFASSEKANLCSDEYYVLTACTEYETSQELISGSTRFGMFTCNLLWGSGYNEIDDVPLPAMYADADGDGKLNHTELFRYCYSEVSLLAFNLGISQSVCGYPANSDFICWGK